MDRVPLEQAVDKPEPSSPKPQGDGSGEINFKDDINYHRMADFMEVSFEDRQDPNIANKLSFLYDWAKELTGSDERITNYMALKSAWRGLGRNATGTTMV